MKKEINNILKKIDETDIGDFKKLKRLVTQLGIYKKDNNFEKYLLKSNLFDKVRKKIIDVTLELNMTKINVSPKITKNKNEIIKKIQRILLKNNYNVKSVFDVTEYMIDNLKIK